MKVVRRCQYCDKDVEMVRCAVTPAHLIVASLGKSTCAMCFFGSTNLSTQERVNRRQAERTCPHCGTELMLHAHEM